MATTSTILSVNKTPLTAGDVELIINHGGKDYLLTESGKLFDIIDPAKGGSTEIQALSDEAKSVIRTALGEVEDKASGLSDTVKAALQKHIGKFPALGAEAVTIKPIREALDAAAKISAAPNNHELVGKLLMEHPLANDFLTVTDHKNLLSGGFSWARLETFKKAKDELSTLLGGNPEPKAIRELLIANYENIDHLGRVGFTQKTLNALGKNGIDFDPIEEISNIKDKVNEGARKVKPLADDVLSLSKKIATENKEAKPRAKVVAKLTEDLEAKTTKLKELTSGEYGGAIASKLKIENKDLMKGLSEHAPDIAEHLGETAKAGASTAAKESSGWFKQVFTNFKRTKPYMTDLAKKEGKTVAEMETKYGALESTRWGKVVVGAAAAAAAVVAGISFFGGRDKETSNAQRILAERDAAAQMGAARA